MGRVWWDAKKSSMVFGRSLLRCGVCLDQRSAQGLGRQVGCLILWFSMLDNQTGGLPKNWTNIFGCGIPPDSKDVINEPLGVIE
jgi:hypothetical protein